MTMVTLSISILSILVIQWVPSKGLVMSPHSMSPWVIGLLQQYVQTSKRMSLSWIPGHCSQGGRNNRKILSMVVFSLPSKGAASTRLNETFLPYASKTWFVVGRPFASFLLGYWHSMLNAWQKQLPILWRLCQFSVLSWLASWLSFPFCCLSWPLVTKLPSNRALS